MMVLILSTWKNFAPVPAFTLLDYGRNRRPWIPLKILFSWTHNSCLLISCPVGISAFTSLNEKRYVKWIFLSVSLRCYICVSHGNLIHVRPWKQWEQLESKFVLAICVKNIPDFEMFWDSERRGTWEGHSVGDSALKLCYPHSSPIQLPVSRTFLGTLTKAQRTCHTNVENGKVFRWLGILAGAQNYSLGQTPHTSLLSLLQRSKVEVGSFIGAAWITPTLASLLKPGIWYFCVFFPN